MGCACLPRTLWARAMVAHFEAGGGVVTSSYGEFAGGTASAGTSESGTSESSSTNNTSTTPTTRVYIWAHKERLSKKRTVERCVSMIGKKGYHAVYNNCEHFASWAVSGEKKSRQLWALGGGVGTIAGAWHVAGYVAGGALGFAAAHGVFILGKWSGIIYLGSDAAERNYDYLSRMLTAAPVDPPKKCCICGKKPSSGTSSSTAEKKNATSICPPVKVKAAFHVEPFINCSHGACRSCLYKYLEVDGNCHICPHPECWEPLPPDLHNIMREYKTLNVL